VPSRIIRDSCTTSQTLDVLSDGAERCFWRLTTKTDDYGRFDADPELVLSSCFPRKTKKISTKIIVKWIQEWVDSGLVVLYVSEDRLFGYFPKWQKHQHTRAKTSKYPDPADENICKHMLADSPVVMGYGLRGMESKVLHTGTQTNACMSEFLEFYSKYPKKKNKGDAEKAWKTLDPSEDLQRLILTGLVRSKTSEDWKMQGGRYIPHPGKWLRAKGWEDETFAEKETTCSQPYSQGHIPWVKPDWMKDEPDG